MMNPYRCAICGETSLVSSPIERCPFCGSEKKYLLAAAEWLEHGKVNMCRQSYKDCLKALELEINNYAYYKCAAEKAENQVTQAIFNRLMKQEWEHAEVFADALGIELPEERIRECCNHDFENMKNSNTHEAIAITFYTEVANRAPEPRIREIFRAIAEVENEHLILTNTYLFRDEESCVDIFKCEDILEGIKDGIEDIIECIEDIKKD